MGIISTPPLISIVFVNYYSSQLIYDSIESIIKSDVNISFEIIIVNNSPEDSLDDLLNKNAKIQIRIHEMGYNAGFSRANNAGMNLAKGDYILLLNGDTLVPYDAINRMLYLFQANPQYIAAGAQLVYPDGSPQISGSYFIKGGINFLMPLPFIGEFLRWSGKKLNLKMPNVPNATSTISVDWINGACMLLRRHVFEKTKGFDEEFFLYAEESEWCYRIRKLGQLCILGSVQIVHLEGATSSHFFDSNTKGYWNLCDLKGCQIIISNLLFIRKTWGIFWFFVHAILYILAIPLFFIKALFRLRIYGTVVTFNNARGYASNIGKLIQLIPNILMKKRYFYKIM